MFNQCLPKLFVRTMFLLYVLGICLALSTSRLARVEQVSCLRYESDDSHSAHRLRPSGSAGLDAVEEHALRLEIIKHKILKKLGLKEAPRVDQRLSSKIANDQLFDILEDEQEDAISRSRLQTERESYQANDARTGGEATNQIYLLPIKPKYENKFLFNITLNARLSKEGIDRPKSVLLTLRKRSPNQPDERCKIVVHKQTDAKVNELERVNRTNSGGLREMGALEAADYESSTSNLVKYRLDRLLSSAFEDWPDAWSTGAFAREERLLLFTATNCDFESAMVNIKYESIQNARSRRNPVDCAPNGQTSGCCREPFHVNFTEIGWDSWILAPSSYNAYYCRGKCDLSYTRNLHSSLTYKFPKIVTQCCSPEKLSPISVIYLKEDDHETVMFKGNLEDMVVEKCSCG